MEAIAEKFLAYVPEVTGEPAAWDDLVLRDVPPFLRQAYRLAEVAVGDHWFLAVIPREGHVIQPAALEKHVARLQALSVREDVAGFCLVAEDLPAYVRKRLIERRIPFVVPGREFYLPQIGQAVRARRRRQPLQPVTQFTPATQSVFLLALVDPEAFPARPLDIAERLGLATMTATRAFNDIEATGLARATRKGYERWLDFSDHVAGLWQKALPYLRNPVRARTRVRLQDLPEPERIAAGETALATWTMLLPPPEPVFAIASRRWNDVLAKAEAIPIAERDTCIVEAWKYDPRPLAREGCVDRFSLWLSLKKEPDERVQSARETLMEDLQWSRD